MMPGHESDIVVLSAATAGVVLILEPADTENPDMAAPVDAFQAYSLLSSVPKSPYIYIPP
jgi:hypothetical protein